MIPTEKDPTKSNRHWWMAPSPEHVVLQFEVQRLRDELREYEQELPCWSAEVQIHVKTNDWVDPIQKSMVLHHICI